MATRYGTLGVLNCHSGCVTECGEEVAPAVLTCCDGTGWTGNPRERCTDHYDAPGFGAGGLY